MAATAHAAAAGTGGMLQRVLERCNVLIAVALARERLAAAPAPGRQRRWASVVEGTTGGADARRPTNGCTPLAASLAALPSGLVKMVCTMVAGAMAVLGYADV